MMANPKRLVIPVVLMAVVFLDTGVASVGPETMYF
jgi:hypothetical protein